jgi:hypothetical protein
VRRSGTVLVYVTVLVTVMIAFASLAVDYARVQLAKTQALRTADAVCRFAVLGLVDGTYASKGIAVAGQNTIDGTPVTLTSGNIVAGTWSSSTHAFTAGGASPNAVKVFVSRTAANGNPISLVFAQTIGIASCDVNETAIATVTYQSSGTYVAPATGDPWLAGMPSGTTANTYDSAPFNSPAQAPITLTAGASLKFSFSGSASNQPGNNPYSPDGDNAWIINNYAGTEHGIANLNAPITAVVGVFLDDSQPDSTGAPPTLDFSTPASRDFSSLSPMLKQPFFIGDGLRADGVTPQNFVVPAGATRLYLGIMDGQQWSDNSGGYTSNIASTPQIVTVK